MPKIGKHSTIIINTRHEVDVNYGKLPHKNSRHDPKVFWIKLPEGIANYMGKQYVDSKTESGVTQAFDKIATDFYSKTSTVDKYIRLKLNYTMFEPGEEPEYSYMRFNEIYTYQDRENEFPAQNLNMEYEIGFMHKIGEKYFFTYTEQMEHRHEQITDPFRTKEKSKKNEMPKEVYLKWTAEREAWIHNMYTAFTRLINGIHTFYASSLDNIQELIANQQKVLTYGSDQPQPKAKVPREPRHDNEQGSSDR